MSSRATNYAAVASTCARLSAVLSDGPDPGADPVGYALAQIEPLRSVRTSDEALQSAVAELASAYQAFYKDSGSKGTKASVAAASAEIDKICPGVAS